MKRLIVILLAVLPMALMAQHTHATDTLYEGSGEIYYSPDSASNAVDSGYTYYYSLQQKPDAVRALWLGALVPGAGQIYNRSYWKLPIVYGGFMGCIYAITLNNSRYVDYKAAYRDIQQDGAKGRIDANDPTKTYNKLLPEGYTIERMGGAGTYTQTLNSWQNNYRRYRDYSIVATILVYGLSLIDAYVDAQLFDFDISPDLSLEVNPQIYYDYQNRRSHEIHLAIRF